MEQPVSEKKPSKPNIADIETNSNNYRNFLSSTVYEIGDTLQGGSTVEMCFGISVKDEILVAELAKLSQLSVQDLTDWATSNNTHTIYFVKVKKTCMKS